MDKKIEKKTWTTKRILTVIGVGSIIGLFVYSFAFMNTRSSLNVETDRLTISTVQEASFQEFIQVTGTVQPINTIFLDAIEGGVIQRVLLESGTNVQPGDSILILTNSALQLSVLNQESSLFDQINNARNSRLNIEQNSLRLRQDLASAEYQVQLLKPQYERQERLYSQELISLQEFESIKDQYDFEKKRYELTYESYLNDSLQNVTQLAQLNDSERRMFRSLTAVQGILDNLVVKAPAEGQLTTGELQQGQSINQGERIGQVDQLDNFKIRVGVDEFHLSRISTGLAGSFTFAGQEYDLSITKVYPVIENGQFQVDMEFVGTAPANIRRGQTVRIRLELGDAATAIQLARGGFYQTTGGSWVFVVEEGGSRAVRREVRFGRLNPEYFEVISGLEVGDQVITSSYSTFGDNEVLILQ